MKQGRTILFWSEFPDRVDWPSFKKLISFDCKVYVACPTKKEYLSYKKRISNKHISVGVWPTLPKPAGYWFSSFTEKKYIDVLDEFSGIPMKIDLEPPLPGGNFTFMKMFLEGVKYFFLTRGKNYSYLEEKIKSVASKGDVILSGFPLPAWVTHRFGGDIDHDQAKNYFIYTTLVPRWLSFLVIPYYKWFVRRTMTTKKGRLHFALGCIGPGIYGDEPVYPTIEDFNKDLDMASNLGIQNLVIFEVGGIMQRSRPSDWTKRIQDYKNGKI